MDIARDKSKFWHRLWSECDREHTGIVYDIMKTARSRYHYLLRALRKKHIIKQNYLSQNQRKLRSKETCYWKAFRAIRKNNFNCTNVVDGVEGGFKIDNFFQNNYKRLFKSVKC